MSNIERLEFDSNNAVAIAKAALSEVDMDDVRRIAIEIEHYNGDETGPDTDDDSEPPQPLPDGMDPADYSQPIGIRDVPERGAEERDEATADDTESEADDRDRDIPPGHSAHEVLTAVYLNEPVGSADLEEDSDQFSCAQSSITSVLARLYDHEMVDRSNSPPYEYELAAAGRAFLNEHGPSEEVNPVHLEADSSQHAVLAYIDETDSPVSSLDLADAGIVDGDRPSSAASAVLSVLYRKCFIDRVGTVGSGANWAYAYEITPFGKRKLENADSEVSVGE